MENRFKKIFEPDNFAKYVGFIVGVLLIVFESIICVQYISLHPNGWLIATVVCCCVLMDIFCIANMFAVKKIKVRIVLYGFDFLCLLVICTITGSSYLSALYCIILSQFYVNVDDFLSKIAVYVVSCIAYIATFVIGWVLNHIGSSAFESAVYIASGSLVGVLILTAHFFIAAFLIHYYRTNLRLTQALKEADESRTRLKEVYEQLSETAVYEERNRIARDIHDNAGHSMTAVIMQTEAAKILIDSNPEEAKQKIVSANIQAKNALEQMRESVHLLAGREESRTVKTELEEIIAQTIDGAGVKIKCNLDDAPLAAEKQRFICNSLKECIANGLRHGGATAFYVEFRAEEQKITLTVSDNGSGLAGDFREGFGIRGLREKAVSFGGSIRYGSEDGDGFEISVELPADKAENKTTVGKEEKKND